MKKIKKRAMKKEKVILLNQISISSSKMRSLKIFGLIQMMKKISKGLGHNRMTSPRPISTLPCMKPSRGEPVVIQMMIYTNKKSWKS